MLPPPGAPDVLTLATVAYKLYDTYKGAPDRLRGLCEDIRGLEIVLKRLENRLIIQDNGLTERERAELEDVKLQASNVLGELQQNVPSSKALDPWVRLKWPQSRVDSLRLRITSICTQIAAFNSSILPPPVGTASTESSQQLILSTLDDILIGLRNLGRPESMASTLVEEGGDLAPSEDQKPSLMEDLKQEMAKHGISEAQINDNREMILRWVARAAAAGFLDQPFEEPLAQAEDVEETWEVISATYGPAVVTSAMQRIFDVHNGRNRPSEIQFSVTSETFGGDSFPSNLKGFSMVWRRIRRRGRKVIYSTPMKVFAEEGNRLSVDLGRTLPFIEDKDDTANGGIRIISACWHNCDVTDRVSTLVKSGQYTIMATGVELLTSDPCPAYLKVLSATWTYPGTGITSSQFSVRTAREYGHLNIPPHLNILCADWSCVDITAVLQTRINQEQTLNLDTNNLFQLVPDPWFGYYKAISIVYQYGSGPLELLVARDGAGVILIKPYKTVHQNYSWQLNYDIGNDITILAVIWGLQPILETPALQKAFKEGKIPCSTEFFGIDGWGGKVKTCQVFLRNVRTGETSCIAEREGSILTLPSAHQ